MTAAVEVAGLTKRFGGVAAVDACSFAVQPGTLTGLIGPNGSGKTTVLNMISGYLRADSGSVSLDGQVVARPTPTLMYRRGVSRTFQRARVFSGLSVRDNLIAAVPRRGWSVLALGVEEQVSDRADQLLDEFRLARLADVQAVELSYGQQKLLEFATVLMSRPTVLLLDEPTAGVNNVLIETMAERMQRLHADGVTIVVVEHNMEFVMGICDPVIVFDGGTTIYQGTPEEVQGNALVLDAYLGH